MLPQGGWGIDLGAAGVFMAQKHLHRPKICAAVQQMRGKTVAQRVRVHAGPKTGRRCVPLDDLADGLTGQSTAAAIQPQGQIGVPGQRGADLLQVRPEPPPGLFAERYVPLPFPLAHDGHGAGHQVHVAGVNLVQRRIRAARFPATKSLDTFDFLAIPSLNKPLVMQLARCEYIERRENVIAIGNSGTGKTHVALGLGLAACQRGMSVGFTTAAALVHELMEARDDRRLLNLQRQLARLNLLIIDELGFVPLSTTGAELLFEVFSQRYERGSILVTTNLPFDEWTEVFGSERLTGALLDRLTHHVHILEMNGDSYRLKGSRQSAAALAPASDRPAAD